MKLKSVMSHNFSTIPDVQIERSKFNRKHGYKTTLNSGYLVPIFVDEAMPGDTFNVSMTAFARLSSPLKYPIMDNLYMDTFFFAVPNRLVWEHWVNLMGEKIDPDDTTEFLVPTMTAPAVTGYTIGSLQDYFGCKTGVAGIVHSALPFRCYNLIWNDWFRVSYIQDHVVVDTDDSSSSPTDYVLLKRNKRHDYFTSALPWPQLGDAVRLPLGDTAPVVGLAATDISFSNANDAVARNIASLDTSGNVQMDVAPSGTGKMRWGQTALEADLSDATAATINELRQAFQIQRMLERDARGGDRYISLIRSHYGVTCPDFRLQRPEYLGGGSTPVSINPIAQNSATGATGTPQGNLAAIGTIAARHGFTKSFTEHCFIIGLVNIRADLTYQQGMDRMWFRSTRYDFYWPTLAHLGEQAVLKREIYMDGSETDDDVFGYQEAWADYRYKNSKITGKFRSDASGSLDAWHLSQEFGSVPSLDETFIEESLPMSRVMAVTTEPEFIFDSVFEMVCARPMPVYSVPGYIDHF